MKKNRLAEMLRAQRAVTLSLTYGLTVIASLYVAYEIRFDFAVPPEHRLERVKVLWIVMAVKLVTLLFARQMGSMITFFGVGDFFRLSTALLGAAGFLIALRLTPYGYMCPPRGVLLIDFLVCLAGLCSFRLGARIFRERVLIGAKMRGRAYERVVIIGAGDTGASLVRDLLGSPSRGLRPVAILDDDADKHDRFIHGVRVEGKPEDYSTLANLEGVRHAIVAMPSAPTKRVGEIALFLGRLGVQVEIVPAIEDLASGRAKVSRIRPVEIQDLLGRPVVELDNESIHRSIEQKVVMVTGAGGSIGSELCRQILRHNPRRLLLFEQSEPALFAIEQELNGRGYSGTILPCVGDIMDATRLNAVFSTHAPQVVFHAAAHKHVYLMERQPAEAIKNNAVGTRRLAEVAVAYNAEAFIFISTDKAINPTSVMGASKRLAELHLQAIHSRVSSSTPQMGYEAAHAEVAARARAREAIVARPPVGGTTKIMAVRFGNVLGSSGSVLPIFKKQIEEGGPVTVTHPEVTRYFMTIPEAVGLVLQASALGEGGEIFVLDMGQPVKILDLAKNMIELSGYQPGEDIEIKFIGLKPGEKLFEELQHHTEAHVATDHPRIMRLVTGADSLAASLAAAEELEPFVDEMAANDIKRNLKSVIPEYTPAYE